MSTTAIASEKKSRKRHPHACVFDAGQVAEFGATARRIQLFGELVVKMLEEEGTEAWTRETMSVLAWTIIDDATAIQALSNCGAKTAKGLL